MRELFSTCVLWRQLPECPICLPQLKVWNSTFMPARSDEKGAKNNLVGMVTAEETTSHFLSVSSPVFCFFLYCSVCSFLLPITVGISEHTINFRCTHKEERKACETQTHSAISLHVFMPISIKTNVVL